MKEYHKIEAIFKRDPETKKVIEEYRNPTIESLKDCIWEFTEKVDGTNIRVHWDGHKVEFGGRTDKAEIPKHLLAKLEELFGGHANEELFEQTFGENDVTLFGEGYGVKIQNGGLYRDGDVSFILFDVQVGDLWLRRKDVLEIAANFNLEVVPVLFEGNLQKGIDYVKTNPDSVVAQDWLKQKAKMEGLVARPKEELLDRRGNRIIVKIKWEDLKDLI